MDVDHSPNFKYIAALGSTTMNKFSSFKIFLYGLRGTGVEVAKNLMLAMPKQLAIQDDEKVKASDLASNPFLHESDVNTKIRSEASFAGLKSLNPNVDLVIQKGDISFERLSQFNLVIFTDTYSNIEKLFEINEFCRTAKEPIGFIYTGSLGLFTFLFVDYGDHFKVYDKDGEPAKWYVIDNISKADPGVVTLDHSKPHSLNTGDFVKFSDIEGMVELNGPECRPVRVTSPFSFTIEDTTEFNEYKRGGRAEEVKVPFSMSFKTLKDALTNFTEEEFLPEWEDLKLITRTRYFNLKLALYSLCMFTRMHQEGIKSFAGQEKEEARIKSLVDSSRNMLDDLKSDAKFEEQVVRCCMQFSKYQLAPLCSFIGGLAAIEAIKFAGKYTPVKGFFFFDGFSCLPEEGIPTEVPKSVVGTRYEDVGAIFGLDLMEKLQNKKLLLIGGGSTASEYIKNLALLGISTNEQGKLIILDEAKVSKFDFNSYFPLKDQDLGKEKAKIVIEEALKLNKDLKCESLIGKAEENSQATENESLWENVDVIICALDYRLSKSYINQKCIWFEKPMMSTAVHGLKGTLQLNIPHITDDYKDISELKPEKYESNIIWNFPYLFEHTIQWATEVFKMCFKKISEMAEELLTDKTQFIERESKKAKISSHHLLKLKIVYHLLFEVKDINYEHLLGLTRDLYKYFFGYAVGKLLAEFPLGARDAEGRKVWKGYYRVPTELPFNLEDEYMKTFIISGSKVFAKMLQVKTKEIDDAKVLESIPQTIDFKSHTKDEEFKNILSMIKLNNFVFKGGKVSIINLYDEQERSLYSDFVASAAYLKAKCYDILPFYPKKFADSKYKVEKVAFNIKLNIPVTNSIVAGLQVIELLKLCQNKVPDAHRNFYLNLGINKIVAAPMTYATQKGLDPNAKEFSVWTKLAFETGDTIESIIEKFAQNFGKKPSRISFKKTVLYDQNQESYKQNLALTPKEILTNAGLQSELTGKKSISLLYDIGEKELKHFLPKLKYKLTA